MDVRLNEMLQYQGDIMAYLMMKDIHPVKAQELARGIADKTFKSEIASEKVREAYAIISREGK